VRARQHYRSGWVVLALAAVVAAAAWLRFHDLARESLWYDEGVSWQMSRLSCSEIVGLTAQDVHPPLYYFLLKGWAWAFGDSVFALRSLSALCGVGTVVAVFFFTRSLCSAPSAGGAGDNAPHGAGGRGAALLAAALTALSIFQISYGREMRMYPLGALLAVLSSWALCAALFRPARTVIPWVAYAVLASALTYTHNFGLFTVAAQALFALGYLFWQRVRTESAAAGRAAVRHGALAFLVVGLAYLPWLPVALGQNGSVVAAYWTPPLSLNTVAAAVENLFTGDREFRHDPDAGPTAVIAVAALLGALLLRKDRASACLALLAVVPFALGLALSLVQGRNILGGRYLYFSSPFFLIGIALVVARLRGPALGAAASGVLIAGFASLVWFHWQNTWRDYHPGLQDAARVILEGHRQGDVVITGTSPDLFALGYYLRGRADPLLWRPSDPRLGHYEGWQFLRDGDLLLGQAPLPANCSRVWFLKWKRTDHLPGSAAETCRFLNGWVFRDAIPYRDHDVVLFLYEREDQPHGDTLAGPPAAADTMAPGGR
jgi:mannosyltransferase